MSRVAVYGTRANETNPKLVAAWRAEGIDAALVEPEDTRDCCDFDVVLGRLDVLPALDGVESGLLQLLLLERGGLPVLNPAAALLRTHDKLRTASALASSGIPHPPTRHVRPGATVDAEPPVVLKPRFGSWGRDVRLCRPEREVESTFAELSQRRWYARHGLLLQPALPSPGFDLRLLVAGGRVVGAVERHPQPGEWRTNVSAGAERRPTLPASDARRLAVAAAAAVGADLVGVDLLPGPHGYTVIELNGAVDFEPEYRADGAVYAAVAEALAFRGGVAVSSR